MNHALRLAAAAALLLGLSGCNNVVSMEPWFTAADARGGPELRDGLWVSVENDGCRANLEKPAERWPDCAAPFYVRGSEWWAMQWDEPDGHGRRRRVFEGWESIPIIVVVGDPAILQLEEANDPPASASESDVIVINDGGPDWRYSYGAMRPTAFDSQTRVIAFEHWAVQCGPLPEQDPDAALLEGYVTKQPFPGLTVVNDHCTAESADAIRRAAVSSRSISHPAPIRWVRDGWR